MQKNLIRLKVVPTPSWNSLFSDRCPGCKIEGFLTNSYKMSSKVIFRNVLDVGKLEGVSGLVS